MLLVLAAAFVLSAAVYDRLPDRMATHWNAAGQPNGYSSRGMGAYLVPAIMCFVAALLQVLPGIDPLRGNVAEFRAVYDGIGVAVLMFLLAVHGASLAMNLGVPLELGRVIAICVAGLFFYLGKVMRKVKQNWFVGIRTPWTMSSPRVWEKTHQMASKLFQGAAAVILMGAFFPRLAIWFVLAPTLAIMLYLIYYSWREAEKEITGER
jgi:immunity protein, SdpI family